MDGEGERSRELVGRRVGVVLELKYSGCIKNNNHNMIITLRFNGS